MTALTAEVVGERFATLAGVCPGSIYATSLLDGVLAEWVSVGGVRLVQLGGAQVGQAEARHGGDAGYLPRLGVVVGEGFALARASAFF